MDTNTTSKKYDKIIKRCFLVFETKTKDYGTAWRILRLPSLTDQILIKVKRVRQLQTLKSEGKTAKIQDSEASEFLGIINYSVMALIQLKLGSTENPDLEAQKAIELYTEQIALVKELMQKKNHDYGDAWKDMRVSSLTDLMYQKLFRIKQIEDNQGKTLVSEGVQANYQDIINYAIFAMILIENT